MCFQSDTEIQVLTITVWLRHTVYVIYRWVILKYVVWHCPLDCEIVLTATAWFQNMSFVDDRLILILTAASSFWNVSRPLGLDSGKCSLTVSVERGYWQPRPCFTLNSCCADDAVVSPAVMPHTVVDYPGTGMLVSDLSVRIPALA